MNEDIINLQEAVAHQGEYLAKMSNELYIQQKEILQLKEKLQKLESKIKEQVADSGIRMLEDETPPPHY